jgi:hypothetical protein
VFELGLALVQRVMVPRGLRAIETVAPDPSTRMAA